MMELPNNPQLIYNITNNSYSNIANEYSSKHTSTNSASKRILEFSNQFKKNAKILDLGCGHGRDIQIFEDCGFKVIGVDNCKELIDIAKQITCSEILEMDILNLDLPTNHFDGIWASAVLHHFYYDDINKILNVLYQSLKPNGKIFISVRANINSLWDDEYEGNGRFYNFFDKSVITNIISKTSFLLDSLELIDKNNKEWIYCNCHK